jgi:hypothetical protein
MKINKHTFAWILFSALFISSCTSLNKLEQPVLTDYVLLKDNQTLGQTFVSDYDGLESIILYLKPEANSEGLLTIHLRGNPQDTKELRSASLSLQNVDSQAGYEFSFQPIGNSNTLNYYLDIELEGVDSKVWVGVAPGGSYINGALYSQGIPQDLQLAFQLSFSPIQALLGLFTEALTWIGWLAATVFLFVPPGWVLLMFLWRGWDQIGWIEKFCLAMGTGLAFYPILLIFTHQLALNLGSLYAWLFPVISTVILTWHYLRKRSLKRRFESIRWEFLTRSPQLWTNLTFLIIVGLIFGVRFWNIRAIEIPMWGDSYQHTMIAQLMIDNGGLFSSWEPYVPYHSLSVHFGFPFSVALFSWVTNLPVTSATLYSHNQWVSCALLFLDFD